MPRSPGDVSPTERFSDRVRDYVRYRPGYPLQVLDVLRAEIGLAPTWIVADVGSGTGLSAELFLANGNAVLGVEPNGDMRAAAEQALGHWQGFRSVDGTAEATTLATDSVDMVIAAQAFHWFVPDAAGREFARILRPGGWIVLVWNTRRTNADDFMRGYETLLVRHGTDYKNVRHDRISADRFTALFGGPYDRYSVENRQALDLEGLAGRLLSSSYTPAANDPRRAVMLEDLERLFRAHQSAGHVYLLYETEIYVGRSVPRAAL